MATSRYLSKLLASCSAPSDGIFISGHESYDLDYRVFAIRRGLLSMLVECFI